MSEREADEEAAFRKAQVRSSETLNLNALNPENLKESELEVDEDAAFRMAHVSRSLNP